MKSNDVQRYFAPIGSCVVYDNELHKIRVASELSEDFSPYDINLQKHILLGIVTRQHRDLSVDVLFCSHLKQQGFKLPVHDKKPSVPLLRKELDIIFKRTVESYIDVFPESCRNLVIEPFSVEDAHIMADNPAKFFNNLSVVISPAEFREFYLRVFTSDIRYFAQHKNKTYFVKFDFDMVKPSVEVPFYHYNLKFDLLVSFKKLKFEL